MNRAGDSIADFIAENIGPVIAGTIAVAVIGLMLWLVIPRRANAAISSITWIYTTNLRQKTLAHDAEWGRPYDKCDAPGFCETPFNVECHRKFYGYEDCHCRDCGCRRDDRGHEYGCSRCCDRCPEYRTWCEYDYHRWPVVQSASTSGNDHQVVWPELAPSREDQRAERLESYQVAFREVEGERDWRYRPASIGDFKRFNRLDPWELKVRPVGDADPVRLLTAEIQ